MRLQRERDRSDSSHRRYSEADQISASENIDASYRLGTSMRAIEWLGRASARY